MELPSKEVYEIIKRKGVNKVHHANSVITSCQFLRRGALLSRGSIEKHGLFQTPQKSDMLDKEFGVWFDVFTDTVDIHERAGNINFYGPVLFVLDLDLLSKVDGGSVRVTKLNPQKWEGKSDEEKWFVSLADLQANFIKGRFDQMLVFRNCGGELSIKECLTEIILDDPQLHTTNLDIYSMAFGALKLAMSESGMTNISISKRKCADNCACIKSYMDYLKKTVTMYSLKM